MPLPIGLDFHTISNGRKWGHWPATPAAQEAELEALRRAAPPNAERQLRVHADFHFSKHKQQVWGDDRAAVQRALSGNPDVQFQTRKLPRLELWREKTRYAFVVSPHGNGLDCHRTWESLVLGNIVIVKRSSLDPLYEGLPVVIVDDWREITRDNLRRWHAQYSRRSSDPRFRNDSPTAIGSRACAESSPSGSRKRVTRLEPVRNAGRAMKRVLIGRP